MIRASQKQVCFRIHLINPLFLRTPVSFAKVDCGGIKLHTQPFVWFESYHLMPLISVPGYQVPYLQLVHVGSTLVQGLALDHVCLFEPWMSMPAYKLSLCCLSVNNGNVLIHDSSGSHELQYDFLCINDILMLCLHMNYRLLFFR